MLRKLRALFIVIGLLLLVASIWLVGDYFGFGLILRSVAIALVIGAWAAWVAVKRWRAYRASDKLMAAVVNQEQSRSSGEAQKLRERFEEAVETLQQRRRRGHSLYDLPWYAIIGAPGSGKTTALLNSGLSFPVRQRTGAVAMTGIGGTRDCDWWFTDQAVFLDTAGRYTTHDSDAAVDSAGWDEFLSLLRKYRKRRPLNGVLLAISAADLMTQGPAELEAHVAAARRRLDELTEKLGIQLPVYLLVTKCDLVAGFTEYFDDLAQDGRSQVWGVTFPVARTVKGDAAHLFSAEYDALIERLNIRVLPRLDQEQDTRRRATMFAFPQQMASLRDVIGRFVNEVFTSTRFERRVLLRGVYLTSGTQEGTPIDRLVGAIQRRFVVGDDVGAGQGPGKAYFIERLLKQVVFAESGLAGVNRGLEAKTAALQWGGYVAMGLVPVIGIFLWHGSFGRNLAYLDDVGARAATLQNVPAQSENASLEDLLPRLDAMRTIYDTANEHRDGTRWGLHQGSKVGERAQEAYVRELVGTMLPRMAHRIERRIHRLQDRVLLYEYFRAYQMLSHPEHLETQQLALVADAEWSQGDPETAVRLKRHFERLLEEENALPPQPENAEVVQSALNTLCRSDVSELAFASLERLYSLDEENMFRLDLAAGNGADRLRRRSGIPFSQPVSNLFTKPVFSSETAGGADQLAQQFWNDQWMWGDECFSQENPLALQRDLITRYEEAYIRTWSEILADIQPVAPRSREQIREVLAILGQRNSPLRNLLEFIDTQTYLVPDEERVEPSGRLRSILEAGQQLAGMSSDVPGTRVTEHFEPIHQFVVGDLGSAAIDDVLDQLDGIQRQLGQIGSHPGGIPANDPAAEGVYNQVRQASQNLTRNAETLPTEVAVVVNELADLANRGLPPISAGLRSRYRQEVLPACRGVVNRYPFVEVSREDVQVVEFGGVFGGGGVYDKFYMQDVARLVDDSRGTMAWRPGVGMGGERQMLGQFEAVTRIRDAFFPTGGNAPGLTFTITPGQLDPSIRQFVIEVDGQVALDVLRGSRPLSKPVTWPGPPPGAARVTFDNTDLNFDGAWGLFKMFEAASPQRVGPNRYELGFRSAGRQARVTVETASNGDPFAGIGLLRRFTCGS